MSTTGLGRPNDLTDLTKTVANRVWVQKFEFEFVSVTLLNDTGASLLPSTKTLIKLTRTKSDKKLLTWSTKPIVYYLHEEPPFFLGGHTFEPLQNHTSNGMVPFACPPTWQCFKYKFDVDGSMTGHIDLVRPSESNLPVGTSKLCILQLGWTRISDLEFFWDSTSGFFGWSCFVFFDGVPSFVFAFS